MSDACQNQSRARQHGRRCHHPHLLLPLNDDLRLPRGTDDDRDHPGDGDEGCCCKGCVSRQKVELICALAHVPINHRRRNTVGGLANIIHTAGTGLLERQCRRDLESAVSFDSPQFC